MTLKTPAVLIVAALIAALPLPAAQTPPAKLHKMPANTQLLVPLQPGVAFGWVFAVGKKPASLPGIREFDVDAKGKPWYLGKQRSLLSPLDRLALRFDADILDFCWLGENALVLASRTHLGFLEKPAEPAKGAGFPEGRFKPAVTLPYSGMRVFPGAKNALYIAGPNPRSRAHEVYVVTGGKAQKVAEMKQAVSAVDGDGQTTFIASGKLIIKLSPGKSEPERLFLHPSKSIRGLAYAPGAGLFYATQSSLGFVSGQKHVEFLKAQDPRIRVRNDTLYILLGKTLEVLKIDGVAGFAKR